MKEMVPHPLAAAPLALAGALTVAAPFGGAAQTIIPGEPECPICSIEIVQLDRIGEGEESDSWLPTYPRDAALLPDGRIGMTYLAFQEPTWYSIDTGEQGSLGSLGEGPGEYQRASVIKRLPGDSILVFDLLRATVIAPDGSPARTLRLDVVVREAVVLSWPDNVVITADMNTPTHAGFSIHTLDFTGSMASRVGSFAENRPYFADRAKQYERTITRDPDGGFVSARRTRYEIESYRADGTLTGSWTRNAEWAPANPASVMGGPEHAPGWQLAGLHVDDDARLWVFSHVGRADWRDVWRESGIEALPDRGEVNGADGPQSYDLLLTRIEVIDLFRGVLIARSDIDGFVHRILDNGSVLLANAEESGVPTVHLASLRLRETR